jgi:precorrin-6B methylase 2
MAAPFITTPADVVEQMLAAADVREDDLLYDLGCGDGRIAIAAAARYGCRAVGIDHDPARIVESIAGASAAGVESLVRFELGDLFEVDLAPASVVAIYLLPSENIKLIPRLARLQPGARVVSHDFEIGDIAADRVSEFTSAIDQYTRQIHVWRAARW